jgi:hypothetical protein
MAAMFPTAVYLLCFLTSAACALLLGRAYRRTTAPVLLWSSICFCLLALNNLAVIMDMILFPQINFTPLRLILALAAVCTLIFAFVWELER